MPVPAALGSIVVGLCIYPSYRKHGLILISLATLLLIVLSLPVTASALIYSLERQHPAKSTDDAPTTDLILLLSGSIETALPPRHHAELGARGDRVLTVLRLLNKNKAPRLLIAGKNNPPNVTGEAQATINILTEMGSDPSKMEASPHGRTTRESAIALESWFKARSIDTVLLVTSAYHMPRSLELLKDIGPTMIPFSANHLITKKETDSILDWIPSAIALSGSTLAINEYLGIWISRWIR